MSNHAKDFFGLLYIVFALSFLAIGLLQSAKIYPTSEQLVLLVLIVAVLVLMAVVSVRGGR